MQLIAGLKYDKEIISQIFSEDIMKDSVIYQDILQKGEIKIILRLLNRKLGNISLEITKNISSLPPEKLESLAEELLNFNSIYDLISWLENN